MDNRLVLIENGNCIDVPLILWVSAKWGSPTKVISRPSFRQ